MSRLKKDPLGWIDNQDNNKQSNNDKQYLQNNISKQSNTSKQGLHNNWTRATFIIREDLLNKLKDLAYTNRSTIKEEINTALEHYLSDKETIERDK